MHAFVTTSCFAPFHFPDCHSTVQLIDNLLILRTLLVAFLRVDLLLFIPVHTIFFFFCVRCYDCAKSSGRLLLGSRLSAVVRQLAPRAWYPLQCLLAKTVGVLSPGVGRSEDCAQEFAPQSHIHSGLNQQDLTLQIFS